MTTRKKPQWKQLHPAWIQLLPLRDELIFWRDNPTWSAAQAANLVTDVSPRKQPPGILKMLDSTEYSRTTTIQGERNYVDSVLHDQETFLIAARNHHMEEASPKEWLSFADGFTTSRFMAPHEAAAPSSARRSQAAGAVVAWTRSALTPSWHGVVGCAGCLCVAAFNITASYASAAHRCAPPGRIRGRYVLRPDRVNAATQVKVNVHHLR